ncbi:MAG TPA: metal ABC transporter permease [Abditibacteriaceae bacterium]|nr:metal ABC transporter permease [Abditibacteriaceae bacterium]
MQAETLRFDWLDPNFLWVLGASVMLGVAASAIGSFALLRGRSLLGDALAHAALPGVCLAFIFAGFARERGWFDIDGKNFWLLLGGASVAGLVAAQSIAFVTRNSRIKEDAAQAIVLSVFFGFGVTLLTRIQHSGGGDQSGLDKFLFGQAASLVGGDVRAMTILASLILLLVALTFKELKLLCFDPDFGRGLGLKMGRFDALLLLLLVGVVVAGLQAVGVVLISALLIIPPAPARFWTDKLGMMVWLSAFLGGLSGALGAIISALAPRLPTGPFMVLSATFVFVVSMLFAPRRGVVAHGVRLLATRRRVRRENLLRDLYDLSQDGDGLRVLESDLKRRRARSAQSLRASLNELLRAQMANQVLDGGEKAYQLTPQGAKEAFEVVRRHRLWEAFLMREASLGAIVADRDAEAVEHFLAPELVAQLEQWLQQEGRDVKPLQA